MEAFFINGQAYYRKSDFVFRTWAKFGLRDVVYALVVEVALLQVREEPVRLGTLEICL